MSVQLGLRPRYASSSSASMKASSHPGFSLMACGRVSKAPHSPTPGTPCPCICLSNTALVVFPLLASLPVDFTERPVAEPGAPPAGAYSGMAARLPLRLAAPPLWWLLPSLLPCIVCSVRASTMEGSFCCAMADLCTLRSRRRMRLRRWRPPLMCICVNCRSLRTAWMSCSSSSSSSSESSSSSSSSSISRDTSAASIISSSSVPPDREGHRRQREP
mmetsp:Transcript_139564/g.389279  ORF Transcript_139564/g.389279 Transcript_139564/m.389279 type:complete len:217 (-) Transcript_139564:1467-2117(-)